MTNHTFWTAWFKAPSSGRHTHTHKTWRIRGMKLLLHPALVYANEWGVNWRRITFWNEVARSDPVEENVNVHVEDIHSARLHRQWWAITPGGGAAIVHHVHRSVGHHVGRKNTPQYLPTTKKIPLSQSPSISVYSLQCCLNFDRWSLTTNCCRR